MEVLQYFRISYPIVVLVVFFFVFILHSSNVAKQNEAGNIGDAAHIGPGGKRLPKRTRVMMMVARELPVELARKKSKAVFLWLTILLLFTYVGDAVLDMTHVMVAKSQQWWCGQAVVVSYDQRPESTVGHTDRDRSILSARYSPILLF